MKVLVCGGRDYRDARRIQGILDMLQGLHAKSITCVVHGASRGADLLAENWARDREIRYVGYPAEWGRLKKAAGPIRNQRMLDEERPNIVVGFPGGDGTADMLAKARAAGMVALLPETPDGIVFLYREGA